MKIVLTKGHPQFRLVGLLRAGEHDLEVETEMGLDARVFYAPYNVARSYLVRGHGVGYGRRNRLTRYEFEPGKIAYVLPRHIESSIGLADLCRVRDWTYEHGATMGSIPGTSMSLLRASLDETMVTAGGSPPLRRIAGGRIHSARHQIAPVVDAWDINAAFASTLAAFHPCGHWRYGRKLYDEGDQFVTCKIDVPHTAQWGPLPIVSSRRSSRYSPFNILYPQDGAGIRGTWTGDEVRSAISHGATIRDIEATYTLRPDGRQPFAHWWEWLREGRTLPGHAGSFLKAASQSLWGVFAFSLGGAWKAHWVNRRRVVTPITDSPYMAQRRDLALADTLSARVRAKVYDEFIVPNSPHVLSVVTDGGLVMPADPPDGDAWRLKDQGIHCHFIDAMTYRYTSTVTGEMVVYAGASTLSENIERMALLERECFGRTELDPVQDTSLTRVRKAFPVSRVAHEVRQLDRPGLD